MPLSLKMHVGPTPSGPAPLPAIPRSARDYMASGDSRAEAYTAALAYAEDSTKKHLGHSPMCLEASPFLAPVAAGVPAGRSETREPAFYLYTKGMSN
jgi:hypothetical protein